MATEKGVSAGLTSYGITVAGAALPDTYQVVSIEVQKGINAIGTARLELIDGDPDTAEFTATDSDNFSPGNAIVISLGYDNANLPIFSGIVTGYQLVAREPEGVVLLVSCKDEAVKMTSLRQTRAFKTQAVSDTITEILGDYPKLTPSIAATTDLVTAVQREVTDWDYIVTRAEANGHIVISDGGTFTTLKPSTAGSPALTLEYGTNLYSFALQVDARTQVGAVTAHSWALDTGQSLSVTAAAPNLTTPGNLKSADLATALGQSTYPLYAPADVEEAPLQKLADALLAKRTLALVRGTVELPGTDVKPGSLVALARLSQRFNGNAFVAGVRHLVADGDWKTTLTLGLEEKWFAESQADVSFSAENARVLLGGDGLCKGTVKAIQPDADGKYRVQVTVPDLHDAELWARLAQPYATADAGLYFFPEVGDQVIVGFLGGAGSSPVVLGSLYTKQRKPAYAPDEKNTKKAIVTNSKLTLEFDDDKKIITLKTPGGNTLVISDDTKGLTLTDQQKNTITLSDKGVAIVSKSKLSLTADQDIALESTTGKITLKAAQDITVKGLNVSATADVALALKGTATAELSASGNTTVKGVMVMIN
jgi:Rhs element Vgr protein